MPLRNPLLRILGVAYPINVYDVGNRNIRESEVKLTASVEVFLTAYSDASRTYEIERKKPTYFILKGLPNDDAQLLKSLYETELLSQHPDEVVDGLALKYFDIV